MPKKVAVMAYLGSYYGANTSFTNLNYAYRNTSDFTEKLNKEGWIVFPPIPDEKATKQHCINYLLEKIDSLEEEDWLLFYYIGHGEKYISIDESNLFPIYMVTSLFETDSDKDNPSSYFTDSDYTTIIERFKANAPNGHLISVLDCCYAFGLINNFSTEEEFHTVFAASNGRTKSAFSDNSFFFKSFKKAWSSRNFTSMKRVVELHMKNDFNNFSFRNFCEIQIASKFQDNTF